MNIQKDEFGPEYVIEVSDASIGMEGFLVIDNTAIGPGKGGVRMTPDVTAHEVSRLARAMTWKNALAGIPFGGAKAGIKWPGGDDELKKQFVQSFARAIKPFTPKKYITAPDVNAAETEMQWFVEATGDWQSATGKPADLCMKVFGSPGEKCGIPHEYGSTGFGVAHVTKVAAEVYGIDLKSATVAIEGFGNVGSFAYKHLREMGATIVAVSDKDGAIYSKDGFDDEKLMKISEERKSVMEYEGAEKRNHSEIFGLEVDILIPASITDVINDSNKDSIKAKLIIEAANIPMTEETEKYLHEKGIIVVPDFVANSGGVISSYAEYRGFNPDKMFKLIEDKITKSAQAVLEKSKQTNAWPREVGLQLAQEKVRSVMQQLPAVF